jgi:hypothetical protein
MTNQLNCEKHQKLRRQRLALLEILLSNWKRRLDAWVAERSATLTTWDDRANKF